MRQTTLGYCFTLFTHSLRNRQTHAILLSFLLPTPHLLIYTQVRIYNIHLHLICYLWKESKNNTTMVVWWCEEWSDFAHLRLLLVASCFYYMVYTKFTTFTIIIIAFQKFGKTFMARRHGLRQGYQDCECICGTIIMIIM